MKTLWTIAYILAWSMAAFVGLAALVMAILVLLSP